MAKTRRYDVGLLTILGIVFIVLKLTHVIDWSWWLVLLPLYGQLVLLLAFFIVVFIVAMIQIGKQK